MRGTLQALAFCHSRNVSHGSMGSGSVLLSTFDDRRANDLIVKLDNFGFGRAHYACSLDLKGGTLQGQQTMSPVLLLYTCIVKQSTLLHGCSHACLRCMYPVFLLLL